MADPDHLTQTAVVSDRRLLSNAEVRKAIQDYVLTLEPNLRNLNQYVSSHFTLLRTATLTVGTDLRES